MGKVEIEVFRYKTCEIGVRNSKRPERFHITKNDIRAGGSNRDIRDSELSEVPEAAEPNSRKLT